MFQLFSLNLDPASPGKKDKHKFIRIHIHTEFQQRPSHFPVFPSSFPGYIFGILMFTLNGEDILTNDWGGVAQSMFSLAQIATYNGMELVRRRTEHTARHVAWASWRGDE